MSARSMSPSILLMLFLAHAAVLQGQASPPIDQRSYHLGGIGAFSEMVGGGVKTIALSAVLTSAEADALIDAAREIAGRNHAVLYREPDLIVTDLFPADVAVGKVVLLIYAGDALDRYRQLKHDKARLVTAGTYRGAAREAIARRFGELLSYPKWKIDALLTEAARAGS